MDEYVIKVTPEILHSISNDTLSKIRNAQNAFEQISTIIMQMGNHWEGAGYESAKEYYEIRKDNYESVFRGMTEHVKNLQLIAGVYEAAEQQNEDAAEMLPGDVII